NLGPEDTSAPYSVTFNTLSAVNGSHALTAVARDATGNTASSSAVMVIINNSSNSTTISTVWSDDALPAGARPYAEGGDAWTWVSSNPTPFSGTRAHQSGLAAGRHEQYFYGATATLSVNAGDALFTYVYLDPGNP